MAVTDRYARGLDMLFPWIPACAGMTGLTQLDSFEIVEQVSLSRPVTGHVTQDDRRFAFAEMPYVGLSLKKILPILLVTRKLVTND